MGWFDEINGGVVKTAGEQTPPARSYFDEINGVLPAPTAAPQPGIGQRIVDAVRGKQDPAYKDLPVFDTYKAFKPDDYFDPQGGASIDNAPYLGASDEQLADVIKHNLGPRFRGMKQDANGYPIVTYLDPKGQEASAYINRPGLDMQDVGRTLKGAVPYIMGGGLIAKATKAAPLLTVQAPAQALGAMATSIAGDAAQTSMGSEQGIDNTKALITGGAAGVGQVVAPMLGAIWRRLVTEPGLIDASGTLTTKGMQAAQQGGLNPADITPQMVRQFAKEFARTGDAKAAAEATRSAEFGIQKTLGETTGRADQLLREQRVRGGTYGEQPAARMKAFDDEQSASIANAFAGDVSTGASRFPMPAGMAPQGTPTIPKRLAPNRTAQEYRPGELGQGIRDSMEAASSAAKKAESDAWGAVGKIEATDEALADLPGAINRALSGRVVSGGAGSPTPAAARMVDRVTGFMKGEAPEAAADWLSTQAPRDVDQMRRHLLSMMTDAATPSDKAAASAIYNGFNNWIRDAADKLAMTNPDGAAKMVVARGISKEAKEALLGDRGTPGARIMASVLEKEDTPEGVIRALFASKPGATKNGVSQALANLKTAFERYLPEKEAANAWNDIRLAYWLRITQGPDGKPVGVQAFKSNLGKARQQEGTVFRQLFSMQEQAAMARLEHAVTGIEGKNLNRSWTGPSVGGMFNDILKALGFNTFAGRMAAGAVSKPVNYAVGQAHVGRALDTAVPSRSPEWIGPAAGAAGSAYGSRD